MFSYIINVQEYHPWLLPLFLLLTIFLTKKWLFTTPKSPKNLPPSPPKLPIIGNLHQMGRSPHRNLTSLARKHGPVMLLRLGTAPFLVVSSAEAAKEVFKTHDLIFSNRPSSYVANGIYDCKDIAFAPYGEYWRSVRGICVNHLLSCKKVGSFRGVREEEVMELMERVRLGVGVVDLSEVLADFASGLICRVALGGKGGGGGRRFKKVLEELGVLLGGFDVGEFVRGLWWVKYVSGRSGRVRRVARELDEFLEVVVREHLDKDERGDFVDVLLEVRRNEKSGFVLDEISIKAIILDMFAAGTDTMFTLMEWTLSELIRHKTIMSKLKNELRSIAGSNSSINEEDLDECHYLKAVIKETLRLHPPLPLLVPRESTHDVELLGYDVAARTRVVINAWAIGRDPSLWQDAEEFMPERFLNGGCVDCKGQFQFIPFGAGRRGCPGAAFALVAVELVLANLVLGFDFAMPGGGRGEDLNMDEGDGLTIHRKFPLCVVPICES